MEFGAEGDLEESVDDLGVGEGLALDRAAMGDVGVLGRGEHRARQGGQRDAMVTTQELRSLPNVMIVSRSDAAPRTHHGD